MQNRAFVKFVSSMKIRRKKGKGRPAAEYSRDGPGG